jgi:hypothetical protein
MLSHSSSKSYWTPGATALWRQREGHTMGHLTFFKSLLKRQKF